MWLELKNISYKYNNNEVIKNLSYNFWMNWVFWILWLSWSGKSTLLFIIGWFLKPNIWSILYNNIDLYSENNKSNYKTDIIWFSYQKINLIKSFTVKENIFLKWNIKKINYDVKWFDYLIDYFEVWNLLNKKVSELSWWQSLRISIIKSAIYKPKILLLDESDSWLDLWLKKKLFKFILEYSKKNLVLFATHDNIDLDIWKKDFVEIIDLKNYIKKYAN